MKRRNWSLTPLFIAVAALAVSCGSAPESAAPAESLSQTGEAAGPLKAHATLEPSSGSSVTGLVTFEEVDGQVKVTAHISGLTPGKHGFHVHEKGDCSAPDATSAGPHFNPGGHDHGGPDAAAQHAGDLGNIEANESGEAHHEMAVHFLTLSDGPNSIMGRAVIVHADPDDLVTQPTGNAGGRLACGIVEPGAAPLREGS